MTATLVKICGLSTPETLAAAVRAGASHVGFVHFAKSPRHLGLADAARLRSLVPAHVKAVLLVVNPSPESLAEAVRLVAPAVLGQLALRGARAAAKKRARQSRARKAPCVSCSDWFCDAFAMAM